MIKFFRKIRQNLIMENKTSKYFKYAIGEIILVVIGILIALQINNWNESKKTKEKERQVLTEIQSDLNYSLIDFDEIIKITNNASNSIERLIEIFETNQKHHDSLSYYINGTNSYDEVDFKMSGYQSLISIGTDLVEDPNIRSEIGTFYSSTIQDIKGANDEVKMDYHEYMLDYYRKDFTTTFNDENEKHLEINDFEYLKTNKEYMQSLKTFLNINKYYLSKLKIAKEEANQLKKIIESHLN